MPFVPRNYDEWKHCITQKCSISLTKKYVQERIIALSNVNNNQTKKFIETWCLSIASFFSGYLAFYFIKMLIISYKFQERSEGADEILIWIPQTSVAIGSTIFFISVFHQFILTIKKD